MKVSQLTKVNLKMIIAHNGFLMESNEIKLNSFELFIYRAAFPYLFMLNTKKKYMKKYLGVKCAHIFSCGMVLRILYKRKFRSR